jgi:hypothetical protein
VRASALTVGTAVAAAHSTGVNNLKKGGTYAFTI